MRTLLRRRPADRDAVDAALALRAPLVAVTAAVAPRALQTDVDAALAARDAAIGLRELAANRGAVNGYAPLGATGKLPAGHIPFGAGPNLVCPGDDGRLSDARTPASHGHGQGDVTGLVTALAARVLDTDARLSDARTPLGHVHGRADVTGLVTALAAKLSGTLLRTTADAARTANTLADIPGLDGFTAAADTDYAFILLLLYQSATTTCGVSLSMNGPAAPAGRAPVWDSGIQVTGGPSTSAMQHKAQAAPDALHTTASVDAANTPRVARFHGMWPVGSSGGAIRPRFAAEVNGTEIKVLKGSWLLIV